jgi:hypothetical protein
MKLIKHTTNVRMDDRSEVSISYKSLINLAKAYVKLHQEFTIGAEAHRNHYTVEGVCFYYPQNQEDCIQALECTMEFLGIDIPNIPTYKAHFFIAGEKVATKEFEYKWEAEEFKEELVEVIVEEKSND